MTPEEEKRIIASWSENALRLMDHNNISHLPENYSVWFEYARGGNKKLKEAIDKTLKEGKGFTHEMNRQLYFSHIVKDLDSRTVVEASNRVQSIMANVLKVVESSSDSTTNYNSELEGFSRQLEDNGILSEGDLKGVISQIVERTKELREKGENLNKKLDESRKEVEMLKNNLEEVSVQVNLDSLTGIANRKAFDEAILSHMRDAKESGKSLCLLMIDVDHFRNFNNLHGHLLGDQVLRIVAQSMKDVIRGKDFVAKYGGEEFAVLLPDTPLRGAEIVAENIRKTIASKELKRKDTGESYGTVTVSAGVALLRPRYDKSEDLIARADKALYNSKKNGRNMVSTEEPQT